MSPVPPRSAGDQPHDAFAEEVYSLLRRNRQQLPPGLKALAPRMIRNNWLLSYREPQTIGLVLERVSQRFRRPSPLAEARPELLREGQGLAADCAEFLRAAQACLQREPLTDSARTTE